MNHLKREIKEKSLKYHIITYGCQMNSHESEKIAGLLEEMGYGPADSKEDADFILFNTCCVRENAEQKTFGNVGRIKKLKLRTKTFWLLSAARGEQRGASLKIVGYVSICGYRFRNP